MMKELLKELVAIPSISRDEKAVADFLEARLAAMGLPVQRKGHNLWCRCGDDPSKPTILLNAHLDTVKPVATWSMDPFVPVEKDGRIYGLGTNDDGASLVSLLAAYIELTSRPQPYNLIYSATAEEEVCGRDGIESMYEEIGKIDLGIMGEPTGMHLAVAEKGLMVLDCKAYGKSGHAAREEGVNAIYKALADIEWFRNHQFEKISDYTGKVKMSVTQINAGSQHNVVPAECSFVVDVRNNGMYSNVELLELIKSHVSCEVKERSTRLNGSSISLDHPVVERARSLGRELFGSPTTSNQAVSSFTTVKIGPGQSSRSHTADEFICPSELDEALEVYVALLDGLVI